MTRRGGIVVAGKVILALALLIPLSAQAACISSDKITEARCILLKHGIKDWHADLDYIHSIDENRGRFHDAKGLAFWIMYGG